MTDLLYHGNPTCLYVSRALSASCWRTCTRNQRHRYQALDLIHPFWHLESRGLSKVRITASHV
jgi:hypothetical protein